VGELSRYLRVAGADAAAPGERLGSALRHRVSDLAPGATALLGIVSLAGRPLSWSVAIDAAGLGIEDGGRALAALRVGHLARSSGEGDAILEPYHDRIREAVAASLSEGDLRDHHLRLMAALERAGEADPELLLLHARGAGLADRAVALAEVAARRAEAALAFDRAAALYREAVEAGGEGLHRKLAAALSNAGRGPEAAAAYRKAIAGAGPAEAAELEALAAAELFRAGHYDEGLATIERVLRSARLPVPGGAWRTLASLAVVRATLALRGLDAKERAEAAIPAADLARLDLCWSASVGFAGDALLSALFQSRHLLLALRAGEPYRLARALAMEILIQASRGAPEKRVAALIQKARAIADRSGHPHAIGLVAGMAGLADYLAGRWKRGLAGLAEGERILADRCAGVAWELDMMRVFSIECLAYTGEMAALAARVPALVEEADRRGDHFAASMLRTGTQNMAWLARDEPDVARREVRAAEGRWSRRGFHVQHFLHLFAHVQIDLYEGDGPAALDRLAAAWPAVKRSLVLRLPFIRICALHLDGRAALAALARAGDGERRRLLARVEKQARALDRERAGWARAYALSLRAGAATAAGDASAASKLDASAEAFDALDMAMHAAITRRHRGRLAGGVAGAALTGVADASLRAQAIRKPERMAAMWLPIPRLP
jgi:eukaryotic-like serine/threonine-protein kinase